MSNSWFRFKHFRIEQDKCGMKVSTDACIQGAWMPLAASARRLLDIGAGTGLLSLMMAQRFPSIAIDALEIMPAAASQAMSNVAAAPWAGRINVVQHDAALWQPEYRYDAIICNPPFFSNSLPAADAARNTARHAEQLSPGAILDIADRTLLPEGNFCVLLPSTEHDSFEKLALDTGWTQKHTLRVRPFAHTPVNRIISVWQRNPVDATTAEDLTIYSAHNTLTAEAADLLRPFYLHL